MGVFSTESQGSPLEFVSLMLNSTVMDFEAIALSSLQQVLTDPALLVMLCTVIMPSGDTDEIPNLLLLLLSDEATLAAASSNSD